MIHSFRKSNISETYISYKDINPNDVCDILNEKYNREIIDRQQYDSSLKELYNIYKSNYNIVGSLGYYSFELKSNSNKISDSIDESNKEINKSFEILESDLIEKGRKAAFLGQTSKSGDKIKTVQGWKPIIKDPAKPNDVSKEIEKDIKSPYEKIRNMSGHQYSDEKIDSVKEALKEVSSNLDNLLSIPSTIDEASKDEFINKKAKQLFRELEPGSYHKDLMMRDVENILIGLMKVKA